MHAKVSLPTNLQIRKKYRQTTDPRPFYPRRLGRSANIKKTFLLTHIFRAYSEKESGMVLPQLLPRSLEFPSLKCASVCISRKKLPYPRIWGSNTEEALNNGLIFSSHFADAYEIRICTSTRCFVDFLREYWILVPDTLDSCTTAKITVSQVKQVLRYLLVKAADDKRCLFHNWL